ncbi:hypothetical protein SG34_005240 [Thalassomonas viridans]|uniref:Uncharacterized protein n=1 Tax=Thalassomonas viridans TaxID=137584 RepID=A0AAF0CB22_9GAMM|nr:hypothetical protein [Thalassomonas viridans]WDE06329.1 hypothetical protein SG34_005240 [Thalassomonas viridans]
MVNLSAEDLMPKNKVIDYDKDLPQGEQAAHNSEVRKRIDELKEQQRLKELLDDTDDW